MLPSPSRHSRLFASSAAIALLMAAGDLHSDLVQAGDERIDPNGNQQQQQQEQGSGVPNIAQAQTKAAPHIARESVHSPKVSTESVLSLDTSPHISPPRLERNVTPRTSPRPRVSTQSPTVARIRPQAAALTRQSEIAEVASIFNGHQYVATSIGVTSGGTPIPAWVYEDNNGLVTKKVRILLVGDGTIRVRDAITNAISHFYRHAEREVRNRYVISAVANPYPDGQRENIFRFPPRGNAYSGDGAPEAAYLWRWIGMHAPDLVVTVVTGEEYNIEVPKSEMPQLDALAKGHRRTVFRPEQLESQLVTSAPANVGSIPAIRFVVPQSETEPVYHELFAVLERAKFSGPSPSRKEMQTRINRTPKQVAQQLAEVYGRDLSNITYIPAVATMGQVRLAKLTDDAERMKQIKQLADPYVSGEKSSKPINDPGFAGHLIFAELADASEGDVRANYMALAKAAADALLNENGTPNLKKMSKSQMSDAVFMSGPILARVGRLAGEAKYFDAAAAHVKNMADLVMREDGLYRHSPLDKAAWGRGNGFPALGLAMILSDLPENHPGRKELLSLYQKHMNALAKHQDYTGAWHQVIDHEESYRELSCTCMITFAMARGVQRGWLDSEKFTPVIQQAWHAIRTRVAPDGTLVDVCTGTGKQPNLRAYFDRTAILGRDARGGAMALLVAVEIASLRRAENSR